MRLWRGLFLPLLLCFGCVTSSEDGAGPRPVRLAASFGEVASCEMLGAVEGYGTEETALTQMMNRTIALGGNALYVNPGGVKPGKSGVAYRCAI